MNEINKLLLSRAFNLYEKEGLYIRVEDGKVKYVGIEDIKKEL